MKRLFLTACTSPDQKMDKQSPPQCWIFSDGRIAHQTTGDSFYQQGPCGCGLDLNNDCKVD